VTEAVLDASAVLKWFRSEGEDHVTEARELRVQFETGELSVIAPSLLWLELLNVAARSWRFPQSELEELAATLSMLSFSTVEPELPMVARWASRGLTAYDAAYVAAAEHAGVHLITDDDEIVRIAPSIATALRDIGTGARG
jgi:predicted nucleic acid-binding protein